MIGLSDRQSLLVTKLLMVVPLMLYDRLLKWRPCGLYACHLYGQACGLKVRQLYDDLVISILITYIYIYIYTLLVWALNYKPVVYQLINLLIGIYWDFAHQ